MMIKVNQKVQKIFMHTETIQQQSESCSMKESNCLTTALGDKEVLKIFMRMKKLYWTQN